MSYTPRDELGYMLHTTDLPHELDALADNLERDGLPAEAERVRLAAGHVAEGIDEIAAVYKRLCAKSL